MTAPRLHTFHTAENLARGAAERLCELTKQAAAERGKVMVALSGGNTPRTLYELLGTEPYVQRLPWQEMHIFFSDERCVSPDDAESNYRMAYESLLCRAPIPAEQVHRFRGEIDPQRAAAEYAAIIRRVSGNQTIPQFDVLLLGLGEDGHTASLFPGVSVPMDPTTLTAAVFVPKLRMWRLTFTPTLINAARQVIFLVSGTAKREPLQKLLSSASSTAPIPAQLVQPVSGILEVYADEAAAT